MANTTLDANTAVDSQLQEFFVDQLKDIYWAEKKLVKTLPKLEEAATSEKLKEAFRNHLSQTEDHVSRLEQVFASIGEEAKAVKCPAMAGIADEGEEIIDETEQGTATRDVGLIFAGQKAEHYEIASYGGLAQLARTLGYDEAVQLLETTLQEEKDADALLTQIAENNINERAAGEPR
jgi:ferritin-like metal-binding protein YciE